MEHRTSNDGQQVLVAEDHTMLLAAIQNFLEMEGFSVLPANNGLHALEMMEENQPDLIVADIGMPKMDGYDLYRAIRARSEWMTIPFIFLTAKADREDILKGKALGAEEYITKPFEPQELILAIRSQLDRT